jgi:integrase
MRDRLIIELCAHAGLRRKEVATLEIKDVDWENNRLNVIGKGNKQRTIPVPPKLIQLIGFFLGYRNSGFIFLAKRHDSKFPHMGPDTINLIVRDAGTKAGITNPNPGLKNINPHSLRHYYARTLKKSGIRIETIAALLGHNDVKTTLNEYGNQDIEEIQAELATIW